MEDQLVPASVRWLVPIAEKLLDQHYRDADIVLSDEDRAEIDRRLTREARNDIDKWLEVAKNETASNFYIFMILLDEMGLLKATDPELNYELWRSDLSSRNWGTVGGAVRMIASDYLDTLSEQELSELDRHVDTLLQSVENLNSRIWLSWLRCQIDKNLDIGRKFLRELILDKNLGDDERFDLREDACSALVSLPHASSQDMECVVAFIVDKDEDEFVAAVALGALLSSEYVPNEIKDKAKRLARETGREELLDTANEHGM